MHLIFVRSNSNVHICEESINLQSLNVCLIFRCLFIERHQFNQHMYSAVNTFDMAYRTAHRGAIRKLIYLMSLLK